MRSTIVFLALLIFVNSTTTETQMELENVPAFVELSNHPVSQAFFSAAALRMKEEGGKAGFSKIMALMNELIHDNRRQIHTITKINSRSQGECLVTIHKLKDRSTFFKGQTLYFKRRGSVSISEKSEGVNVMNSRIAQRKSYLAIHTDAASDNTRRVLKLNSRIANAKKAINAANAALRAINDWSPKTQSSFIEESVKKTAALYIKVQKFPLTVPVEMIQLAANDQKLRKRLFEWMNLLKASIVDTLARAQANLSSVTQNFNELSTTIRTLRAALSDDAKKLKTNIANFSTLIKVYSANEKIYSNLSNQNSLLIQANNKYCTNDLASFNSNRLYMEAQLKVFLGLRIWLRKNFHRVKTWIKRKYAGTQ